MKKYIIAASILVMSFVTISCKDDVKVVPVDAPVDTVKTEIVDTVAAKKLILEEKAKLAKPYNDTEDAQAKITELVKKAGEEGKYVFVQAGGNWCIWCLRFNDFVQNTPELKQVVDANYVYYHLNYSKENKNEAVFDKYAPEGKKLGFPFFFVLNEKGEVINTIGSQSLESDNGYDVTKVKQMFLDNAPKN